MKKGVAYWLFVGLFISFFSASVSVDDYSMKGSYSPSENISGTIDLEIVDESFISTISSSSGDEISLGDFLNFNLADYICFPLGCSTNYDFSSGEYGKTFEISSGNVFYGGFVLNGADVRIENINFSIQSDFSMEETLPLTIDFFEGEVWNFNEFSEDFSSENTGCYDHSSASAGPFIRTSAYCELILTPYDVNKFNLGAYVDDGDTVDLTMILYPGVGGQEINSCSFDPSEGSCEIEADSGNFYPKGTYQVCVESDEPTNYSIYEENEGENCGFVYSNGPSVSVKDYGIFLQVPKYFNASILNSSLLDFLALEVSADDLINYKYGRNCLDGCVLPLKISGVSQELYISDLVLDYSRDLGDNYIEDKIYDLTIFPSLINFSGVLDLSLLNFQIFGTGNYLIYLEDEELISQYVQLVYPPLISSISPLISPAGVPIEFKAIISYSGSENLSYDWEFGDSETSKTSENSVIHVYEGIRNYTLKLKVSAGNFSSESSFNISSIDPTDAINFTLYEMRESLDNFSNKVDSLPDWYSDDFSEVINLTDYFSELDNLEDDFDDAFNSSELVEIAKKVYDLDFPVDISSVDGNGIFLLNDLQDINSLIVIKAEGVNLSNSDEYKDIILNWQRLNIISELDSEVYSVEYSSGEVSEIFKIYSAEIISKTSEEGYIIIEGISSSDFSFKEDVAREIESSFVVDLGNLERKSIEFFSSGLGNVSIFVSPKLSLVFLNEGLDTSCNYNSFCEKGLGEDYKSCRSDCKPVGVIWGFVIFSLFFLLIIYTIIQVWYRKHYENHLFGDSKHLYNLLMYISNSRNKGLSDKKIRKMLKESGWTSEKISYAINKSYGTRSGFYEIIPVEKIENYFRKKKKKKLRIKRPNVVTRPGVNFRRNINKY
jgi:hypothetical protein